LEENEENENKLRGKEKRKKFNFLDLIPEFFFKIL